MTEGDWIESSNLVAMLDFLQGRASERKLRLLGCGCSRHLRGAVRDSRFDACVEAAESYADGSGSKAALRRARQGVNAARHELPDGEATPKIEWTALWLAEVSASENAYHGVAKEIHRLADQGLFPAGQLPRVSSLLRDIFGNPFHSVTIPSASLTPAIVELAQTIYDRRDFDRIPNLADALSESRNHNEDVIAHFRGGGEHVRGCWALDLLLGKT